MKIISYNINSCNQAKVDQIFKENADVYVVPEIANQEKIKLPDDFKMEWAGDINYPSKGLGIIWRKDKGEVADWYAPNLHYAIPLVYDGVLILGFWPTKIEKAEKYSQIAMKILEHYSDHLKQKPCIITGDFNLYHKEDNKNKDADLTPVNDLLLSNNFISVYHHQKNETPGHETKYTYNHQFKKENPFFLDYTYTNSINMIKNYDFIDLSGKFEKTFSDHVGQIIEV